MVRTVLYRTYRIIVGAASVTHRAYNIIVTELMSSGADLLKVLYMNAQYLIVHVCRAKTEGELHSDYGVDCDAPADVKIYGRTAIITDVVRTMLVDIAKSRSCVVLADMQLVKQNGASSGSFIYR